MNSSQLMDKQMMGLSARAGAQQGGDPLDLLDPAEGFHSNGRIGREEGILPSYDFQPIRRSGSLPPPPPSSAGLHGGGAAAWGPADSKPVLSGFNNYGSLEAHESSKVIFEKNRDTYDTVNVAEIDLIVKKYADILLHAVEGVSSRLSQLEGRTRSLESAVDDLKLCIGNNHGSTDGKLRQLENILREVHAGVQVMRDKQIAEAGMQLAKLQAFKGDDQPQDNATAVSSDSQQPTMPISQPLQWPAQPSAAPPPPLLQIPSLPAPPAPNAPPPPEPPQQNPLPVQFSSQVPQHQISSISSMLPHEPYFPRLGQPPVEHPQQHYQPPPQQTQVPPPQSYEPTPQLAQYSQPLQPPQHVAPPHLQPSLPHHPEESTPYVPPPQAYPPSIHQPSQLQTGPRPQQICGSATDIYDHPTSRPTSGQQSFPTGYGPPSGPTFSESFPYGGSLSTYSSAREPSPFSSSPAPPSGSSYPRLPTAQILPPAPTTGSSSSGSTGNRVPIDDVVDRVTTMGFPRDLVRATVRKLTENGQSVDLNVVLDKLMNDGEGQPKGWFGR